VTARADPPELQRPRNKPAFHGVCPYLQAIKADASPSALPPYAADGRATALARTLARTAAAAMLRRDVRSPFAVELSKQPSVRACVCAQLAQHACGWAPVLGTLACHVCELVQRRSPRRSSGRIPRAASPMT
jgi:hypothetical protein